MQKILRRKIFSPRWNNEQINRCLEDGNMYTERTRRESGNYPYMSLFYTCPKCGSGHITVADAPVTKQRNILCDYCREVTVLDVGQEPRINICMKI